MTCVSARSDWLRPDVFQVTVSTVDWQEIMRVTELLLSCRVINSLKRKSKTFSGSALGEQLHLNKWVGILERRKTSHSLPQGQWHVVTISLVQW